ncbi:hypothetical protein PCANC_02462 [Puccinia coronata f. sp. avenae]|uniref:Uncharacterized protein n=1 Tax=Puccinia coronata f. sp. avenae TaxID=200324 RepID=A0A2N5W4V9_9BASI|nr:hypothetical protein PCANC_02462 [Puccinia coronata f. sp. avenae]
MVLLPFLNWVKSQEWNILEASQQQPGDHGGTRGVTDSGQYCPWGQSSGAVPGAHWGLKCNGGVTGTRVDGATFEKVRAYLAPPGACQWLAQQVHALAQYLRPQKGILGGCAPLWFFKEKCTLGAQVRGAPQGVAPSTLTGTHTKLAILSGCVLMYNEHQASLTKPQLRGAEASSKAVHEVEAYQSISDSRVGGFSDLA